jgi:hypothetical protein
MDLDEDEIQEYESDIETELEHLKEYNNEKQLELLRREIGRIIVHGLFPSEGWYDERFEYIYVYSQLGWFHLAQRFHNEDQYIHDTSLYIMRLIDELLEERGSKPNFHLRTYYNLIYNIYNIWNYYKQLYCDDDDADIMKLISGMTGLMK